MQGTRSQNPTLFPPLDNTPRRTNSSFPCDLPPLFNNPLFSPTPIHFTIDILNPNIDHQSPHTPPSHTSPTSKNNEIQLAQQLDTMNLMLQQMMKTITNQHEKIETQGQTIQTLLQHVNTNRDDSSPRPRPMKENYNPSLYEPRKGVQNPTLGVNFELKPTFLALLPTFRGLPNEDPYDFIEEFQKICDTLCVVGITQDAIRLRAFPFTLKDKANQWCKTLEINIYTWEDLKEIFLKKYFPLGKMNALRHTIETFSQLPNEYFHDSWERFKESIRKCPGHNIPKDRLIIYFYNGVDDQIRGNIDSSCGGYILDRDEDSTWEILENMAESSRNREAHHTFERINKKTQVNSVDDTNMAILCSQIDKLVIQNKQLMEAITQPKTTHSIHHDPPPPPIEYVSWIQRNQYQQTPNKLYTQPQLYLPSQSHVHSQSPSFTSTPSPNSSFEQLQHMFNEFTARTSENISKQFKQMEEHLEQKLKNPSPLPSQTVPNPNSKPSPSIYGRTVRFVEPTTSSQPTTPRANKITLRSGKEVEIPSIPPLDDGASTSSPSPSIPTSSPIPDKTPIPFPEALNKKKQKLPTNYEDIEELLKNIIINLPLFKALEHIPAIKKYLKHKCTSTRTSHKDKIAHIATLPKKQKDPGAPLVTCTIGDIEPRIPF